MALSPKQKSLYWRAWAQVRKILIDLGGYSPADADAERAAITAEALGAPKSTTAFSNRDLDKVLDAFDSYKVLTAGPTTAPTRADRQPAERLIWSIRATGLGDAYIASIAQAQFRTGDLSQLTEAQLAALRWTCIQRARSKKSV